MMMARKVRWQQVAAGVIALCASAAWGQVAPVYNDRVLDANPQLGAGGSNQPIAGYAPINGNAVINGNVSGLGYFHGNVPYTDPYAFHGSLGSGSLNNFQRSSAPVNYTSGNGVTTRTFFNPNTTVTGLSYNGRVAAPVRTASGDDSTFSYYGTSSLATRSSYVPQPTQSLGNPLQPVPLGASAPSYNFDSLAVPPGYSDYRVSALYATRPLKAPEAAVSKDELNAKTDASGPSDNVNQVNGQLTNQQVKTAVKGLDPNGKPLNNATAGGSADENRDSQSRDPYRYLLAQIATKAGGSEKAVGEKNGPLATGSYIPGTTTPVEFDPTTGKVKEPKSVPGKANANGYQSENPALPNYRPKTMVVEGDPLKSKKVLQSARKLPALLSLAGDEKTSFNQAMAQAETQMEAGKYLRAADSYQAAISMDPDNALALVGRAHAELAAGLYESAAYDLKFIWERKPQLVAVHYNLAKSISGHRLDFLSEDLNDLAHKGARPAAFLQAYLQYQLGQTGELDNSLQYWKERFPGDPWQETVSKAWVEKIEDATTQP